MEEPHQEGPLEKNSLSRLLCELQEKKSTGWLTFKAADGEYRFPLTAGCISATPDILTPAAFGKHLREKGIMDSGGISAASKTAKSRQISFFKALIILNEAHAQKIWAEAEHFILDMVFELVTNPEIDGVFQPGKEPPLNERLVRLPIIDIILEGSRQTAAAGLIHRRLLQESEIITLRTPKIFPEIRRRLDPMEAYVLGLIDGQKTTAELKGLSELGPQVTEKILHTFFYLDLLQTRAHKSGDSQMGRLTPREIKNLLETLNIKSMAVFKYISKEIGPVAQTVLEKHVQDAKSVLPPLFTPVRLLPEGRLDIQPLLKKQALLTNKDAQAELVRGMNEILSAEILAVRKTLGSRSIPPLVEILKKLA